MRQRPKNTIPACTTGDYEENHNVFTQEDVLRVLGASAFAHSAVLRARAKETLILSLKSTPHEAPQSCVRRKEQHHMIPFVPAGIPVFHARAVGRLSHNNRCALIRRHCGGRYTRFQCAIEPPLLCHTHSFRCRDSNDSTDRVPVRIIGWYARHMSYGRV